LPAELRRPGVPAQVRAWVARQIGAPVVRVRRLAGASSTAVHRVEVARGAPLVLRRYVWPGFLEDEPLAPQREVEALGFAVRHGLAAPAVVAADVTGEEVGDGVPVVLMSLLPGTAVAVPDPGRLAEVAAAIHDVDPAGFGHDHFPWYEGTTTGPPPGAGRPEVWQAAIEVWKGPPPASEGPPRFIHRDFHPGNVLWSRGRATGVVDWANACRGPWGCDVGTCRRNLVDLGGPEAADRFLAAYESLTCRTYHPYWEISSILEGGSSWSPASAADAEPRLADALDSIGMLPGQGP
jgi:aminoglycoside phosphotransferase (APT) family kinase protein